MKLTAQWYQEVLSGLSPLKVTENNIKDYLQILNTKEKNLCFINLQKVILAEIVYPRKRVENINQLVEDHIKLFGPAKYKKIMHQYPVRY